MQKEILIETVYAIEFEMFDHVHESNGKPLSPDETDTFRIMRLSHLKTWSEALLNSYLQDLETARASGTNLMAVKYGRMMERTFPEAYERIKECLPAVSDAKKELAGKLTTILMKWEGGIRERYPFLDRRGRPLYSKQDSPAKTSFETYARGELANYSEETLTLYLGDCEKLVAQGINGTEAIYRNMVQMYGYASLEDAANRMSWDLG